jgi:hypothetical protein
MLNITQKKINRILIVVLVVIASYLIWQKATEPYRTLYNQCYYTVTTSFSGDIMTDEWLEERRDYCQDWARENLNERGD